MKNFNPCGPRYGLNVNYNVCQKYLERLYSFKNVLPPSCFRGINESVNPLPPYTMLDQ